MPPEQRNLYNIEQATATFDGYSQIMQPFFDANKRVALAIDEPELRRGAELTDLSAHQTDLIAALVRDLLLAQVGGEAPDGVNTPAEIAGISRRLAELRANEQLIATKATGAYRPLAEDLFSSEEIIEFPELVDEALATTSVEIGPVMTTSAGDDPETFGYTVFRTATTETLRDQAADLEAAASARQRWFAVLAAVTVLVAGLVTWLVSRSITRPLRSLTYQAKDMAERKLPDAVVDILETPLGDDVTVPTIDPVTIETRDEVADVADALNTVQDTALDLAVEQAVLRRNIADSFVNLGRRNQNLLGRQLDFITELESNEADPDTLANLFRLDHLATRMRRNAESLLVLAGIEPPRKWAAPVRITDVIRAALGEVEDYQRVTVRGVEPATIVGSAAADLAHLLAELVENALGVLAPRPDRRHPGPQPPRRLHAGGPRLGPGHAGGRRRRRQPPPGRRRELHHRAVPVPRPLRGRQPGRPPRHRGPRRQRAGQRHHRDHRPPGHDADRRRRRPGQPGDAAARHAGAARRRHARPDRAVRARRAPAVGPAGRRVATRRVAARRLGARRLAHR